MPHRKTIIDAHPKKGGLSKFGYHADDRAYIRRKALLRGASREGFAPLIRRLSLEATYLKNNSPKYARIFKSDQVWLSKKYQEFKQRKKNRLSSSPRLGLSRLGMINERHSVVDEPDEEDETSVFDSDESSDDKSEDDLSSSSDEEKSEFETDYNSNDESNSNEEEFEDD